MVALRTARIDLDLKIGHRVASLGLRQHRLHIFPRFLQDACGAGSGSEILNEQLPCQPFQSRIFTRYRIEWWRSALGCLGNILESGGVIGEDARPTNQHLQNNNAQREHVALWMPVFLPPRPLVEYSQEFHR